jgi:hypothetical protein
MRYPPDEFTILRREDFADWKWDEMEQAMRMAVLVNVDEARITGNYRVVVGCGNLIRVDVPANTLVMMGGSAAYRIQIELWPGDVALRTNMMTSEWMDLDEG